MKPDEEASTPCASHAQQQNLEAAEPQLLGPAFAACWSKLERSALFKAGVIAAYVGSNMSLNILNKWTLSSYGFHFPLLMAMMHMMFSCVALGPVMLMPTFRDLHAPTLRSQWLGIVIISALFTMNVGLNNISLVYIPLSLNQVIRAAIPIFAALSSTLIEARVPSTQEFLSLLLLALGVGMAVWEGSDNQASSWGTLICVLGTASSGMMVSSMSKLLSQRVDVPRLTFYTAPLTCIMMAPFFYRMESAAFSKYQRTHSTGYVSLLLCGCINALAYNLIHSYTIKITSAVTTTVIGDMKIIMILLLSSLLLGESEIWTLKMLVGCIVTVIGFCMYSHARLVATASTASSVLVTRPCTGSPSSPPSSRGEAGPEAPGSPSERASSLELTNTSQESTPLLAR